MPHRRGPVIPKRPIPRPASITVRLGGEQVSPRHALTQARREAGYSMQSLSVEVGMSRDVCRHWEFGLYVPSVEKWIDAMQACGYRVVIEPNAGGRIDG